MSHRFLRIFSAPIIAALAVHPVLAEDVVVTVAGARDISDEVACRLYSGPRNFPFGKGTAGEVRTARSADGTACIFSNLAPGSYALVAALLPKGQDDVTRDFLGRPRQPWGVSNNIRHALRAPRYDEAVFTVERGKTTRLRITLAK
jgi:uncharacterized protein (DUF2141 family)